MIVEVKSPCMSCHCRSVGCHAKCPDYAKYRTIVEETRKNNHLYNIKHFARRKFGYGGNLCQR